MKITTRHHYNAGPAVGGRRAVRRPTGARAVAALVSLAMVTAACSGAQEAIVSAEPGEASGLDSEGVTSEDSTNESGTDQGADGESEESDDDASVEAQVTPAGSGLDENIIVQQYTVPYVPPIRLPDLSVLSEAGDLVAASLGDLAGDGTGLEILGAECAAEGGELVYQGSEESNSFLEVDTGGSGTYSSVHGPDGNVEVTVNPDGSGTYSLTHGREGNIDIVVNADGSGTYEHVFSDNGNLTIEVAADGTGFYERVFGNDGNVRINIYPDGSGDYEHNFSGEGNIDLVVNADGTGLFEHTFSSQGNITIEATPDGGRRYEQVHGPDGNIDILINADGSGAYEHTHSSEGNIDITVDSNGIGTYEQVFGPNGNVEVDFVTDIGILDPNLTDIGPNPIFFVADRFPSLAKLGSLAPPCVTVVRLDADVLFDFDSDVLRAEAGPVVEQVAASLLATGKSLEVHGHTDALGSDAYNLDLSERRAVAFAQALMAQGVTAEITTVGFGETQPVAPNENADGTDDPAGRQLNRRIEIVIPE